MILHIGTWWDHHEIHLHVFTTVVPDKVEMRDQKVQTATVEIRDQQDTRVQEQGSLLLDAKSIFCVSNVSAIDNT